MMHELGIIDRLSAIVRGRALSLRARLRRDPLLAEENAIIKLGVRTSESWASSVARLEDTLCLPYIAPVPKDNTRNQLRPYLKVIKPAGRAWDARQWALNSNVPICIGEMRGPW